MNSFDQAGDAFPDTVPFAGGAPEPIERPDAEQIGPYHILGVLGQGGMGLVYEAEQLEPLHRLVALKIIKLGMDTKEVLSRFETERQALAVMDHPTIAKALDAGSTDTGRPYFVMELVRGVPLTDYCDTHQLSTRQRLELFISICQGVQHARSSSIRSSADRHQAGRGVVITSRTREPPTSSSLVESRSICPFINARRLTTSRPMATAPSARARKPRSHRRPSPTQARQLQAVVRRQGGWHRCRPTLDTLPGDYRLSPKN